MRKIHFLFIYAGLVASCNTSTQSDTQITNATIGNKFIDAFYSFNRDSLESLLYSAEKSKQKILYYQKWAECANYKIINRNHYVEKNDSTILFPITVKDDLMTALAIDFNVTDTFHITVENQKIISVTTSSNDIATYYEAIAWVKKNRTELVEIPCKGNDAEGVTPCDCVIGMIKGFAAFRAKEQP